MRFCAKSGIDAARRWLKEQHEQISRDCGGCLEVFEQRFVVAGEERIPFPSGLLRR